MSRPKFFAVALRTSRHRMDLSALTPWQWPLAGWSGNHRRAVCGCVRDVRGNPDEARPAMRTLRRWRQRHEGLLRAVRRHQARTDKETACNIRS
jgi:hypothetical protein